VKILEKLLGGVLATVVILAFILFWCVGPGGVIAVAEWPFGIGPFSSQGSYCTDMHRFAADISIATNNPSSGNISTVKTAYGNLISSAPNQTVVSDLNNWLSAEQSGNSQEVSSAATTLNGWIASTCSSPAYKLPYQINQFYGGFFGPF